MPAHQFGLIATHKKEVVSRLFFKNILQ